MGIEAIFSPDGEEPEVAIELPPEPEPEPAPLPEIETPPVPAPEEAKSIPLPTFLDMRDDRNELRRWKAEREAQDAKQPEQPEADPYDDPRGFREEMTRQFETQRVQDRLDFSYQLASDKHGAEKVEESRLWALERAKTQPGFGLELDQQKHPMEWIVQQHAKSQDLTAYEADPIAFARAILEKHGQVPVTAALPVAVEQKQAPQPPKSLASTPGKGGLAVEPTESVMGSIFGR